MPAEMPDVPGVTHRWVQAAGMSFHVAEAGEGDPVLLLHGWPQHWLTWRGVIGPLAADRHVICPDLRGFGWSDAPPGDYRKQRLADDVIALMDALGLEQVDLVGHDWGGWVGFLLCLGHPQRFRHYLALNIPTPWAGRPSAATATQLLRLGYQVMMATPGWGDRLLRNTDLVARMIRAGAVHKDAWTRADLHSYIEVLREPARAAASAQLYRTFLRHEALPYARGAERRRLTVPTLLVHGVRDLAVDHRALGDWRRHADEMFVELREDSGHFICEELPELVAARARALFDGTPPRAVVDGAGAARTAAPA